VTKVIDRTAFLSLIDERRLALDTPVSGLVPGFSPPANLTGLPG